MLGGHARSIVLVGALATCSLGQVASAATPAGFQDYVIIGHEEHVWDMFNAISLGEGYVAFDPGQVFRGDDADAHFEYPGLDAMLLQRVFGPG